MTIDEWLKTRRPAPPDALGQRVRELLAPHALADAARATEECLEAGEALLADLLRGGCTSRESALDLLAIDALVTYAFEAAGENPGMLNERAHRAMARISAVADAGA